MVGQMAGSYRIISQLGEGGMGIVYLAEHPLIGRRAVVKFLRPEFSANADVVARFFNEARSAALIKHPGIVEVFDFGYHASKAAFIIMEFLEGQSLADCLSRMKQLSPGIAVEITKQIALALKAAHAKDIVHRDLKPDNIFLVPTPDLPSRIRVKVLDFGIAKLAGEMAAGFKTNTNALLGTPAYMSPEQCKGAGHVDYRADIYSLGCVFFEMLCGRPPFVAESPGEMIASHLVDPVPAPSKFNRDVLPNIESVILRSLAKKPVDRYQSMSQLIEALAGVAPVTTPQLTLTISSPTGSPAGIPTVRTSPRMARIRLLTILAAVVLLATAGIILSRYAVQTKTTPDIIPSPTSPPRPATPNLITTTPLSITPTDKPPNPQPELPASKPRWVSQGEGTPKRSAKGVVPSSAAPNDIKTPAPAVTPDTPATDTTSKAPILEDDWVEADELFRTPAQPKPTPKSATQKKISPAPSQPPALREDF